jgi:hypothetical protein
MFYASVFLQFTKQRFSQMADHSDIVGGSTAKRVIACPGSVQLCRKMPPKPSSVYADTGTLLHDAMASILSSTDALQPTESVIGMEYAGIELTQALYDEKIAVALAALEEIDPENVMDIAVEKIVGFGEALPGVFGSADLIGRIGDRAVVLDWKFGDGVAVEVEENAQALFYAAAAMRTPETQWAFDGVTEIECVIVQPPFVKRWVTTPKRVVKFERQLFAAVKKALRPNAPFAAGDHCRWCAAKPICPILSGGVMRALQTSLKALDADALAAAVRDADVLEEWIKDVRALAHQLLEQGLPVPGFKLVPKRATRQWLDEDKARDALAALLPPDELMVSKLVSPAQAEKALKKRKIDLPGELVVAVSSGNTLAPESDPRPAVMQIGQQLSAALGKIV